MLVLSLQQPSAPSWWEKNPNGKVEAKVSIAVEHWTCTFLREAEETAASR